MFAEVSQRALAILQETYSVKDVVMRWQRPVERSFGDLSTSLPLQLAKKLQVKPREIAEKLASGLEGFKGIERVEIAGAGYVNVWLTPAALFAELTSTVRACSPLPERKNEKPVLIDYSQPNIAKPLGIHHILSTVIGQVLVNIHRHLGFQVVGINYIGDWGTQFGKLAVAMNKWGKKPVSECSVDELLELYVRFHNEAEKDPALDEEARVTFRKLEQGDSVLDQFLQDVVKITMANVDELYKRLHVAIDVVRGEYYYRRAMGPVIEEGKRRRLFVEGEEGALIVQFPEESKLSPSVVLKGDGATVYLTRDLAAVRDRIDTWHPEAILYVVDVSQMLHLQQVFETCRLLGWDLPQLEHIVFGRMRFADKSMSTRKGNILKLQEVLDEAVKRADSVIGGHGESIQTDDRSALAEMMGVGGVVYGILSQNRKMDIIFDWKKALALEGNSAPYLQYTHARARSVLRKAELKKEPALPKKSDTLSPAERTLIGTLLEFSSALNAACEQRMPHSLTNYLYALCQDFNAFYNADPILKAEEPMRSLRLALTSLTSTVLKTGAELLTLRVPDRM